MVVKLGCALPMCSIISLATKLTQPNFSRAKVLNFSNFLEADRWALRALFQTFK